MSGGLAELGSLLVLGLAAGSVLGLAATGLVLTYRTSGVFNFAHGAVAAVGAFAWYELTHVHHLPGPVAAVLCIGLGAPVLGWVLERLTRRIVAVPLHLQVGATVGLILVLQDLLELRYGTDTRFVPDLLDGSVVDLFGIRVAGGRVLVIAIGLAGAAATVRALRSTRTGRAWRAVVEDPVLLALTGTEPRRARRSAWTVGSGFAIASGILIAPTLGLEPLLLTFLVVQAFGAAAVGRFEHLGWTFAGGAMVGVASAFATRFVEPTWSGIGSAAPFVVLYVVVLVAPPRPVRAAGAPAFRPVHLAPPRPVVLLAGWLLVLLAVPPLAGARLPVFTTAVGLVVVLASLGLIVHVAGQVSLGHGVFCAVGAATIGHLAGEVPWPLALVVAAAAAVPLGVLVALPAARLAGLPLAVSTFGLAVVAQQLLYPRRWLFGDTGTVAVARPSLALTDVGYFRVAVAVAALVTFLVLVLLRSRLVRLASASADEPVAAAALGASPGVTRVLLFTVSAFLAGLGGALLAGVNDSASAVAFSPLWSLLLVTVVAIAGGGPITGALRGAAGFGLAPVYLEPFIGPRVTLVVGVAAVAVVLVRARPPRRAPAAPDAVHWRLRRGPVQARAVAR